MRHTYKTDTLTLQLPPPPTFQKIIFLLNNGRMKIEEKKGLDKGLKDGFISNYVQLPPFGRALLYFVNIS